MADKSVRVEVRGLAELNRAFRQVESDLPNELKGAFRAIAEDVAQEASGKVPHRSGRAAGSIKPRAGAKGAAIAFGGSSAPYFPWLNFGGSTGRGHVPGTGGSGAIKRPLVKPDRYVYSTITDRQEKTRDAVDKAITSVAHGAGFETRGSV